MGTSIKVKEMACEHCEEVVEEALVDVDNVSSAMADRDSESVTIEGDADIDAVIDAIDEAGYDASAY